MSGVWTSLRALASRWIAFAVLARALAACSPALPADRFVAAAPERVVLANHTLQRGQSVSFEVRHGRLPPGAELAVYLVRDVPADESHHYAGYSGALFESTVDADRTGTTLLHWDGQTVACAPADAPMRCGPVEIGRYRFEVSVLSEGEYLLPGLVFGRGYRPPKVVASLRSAPVQIVGDPDLQPLQAMLRPVAVDWVNRNATLQAYLSDGKRLPLLTSEGPIRSRLGAYCATFLPAAPLNGTLTACTSDDALGAEGLRLLRDEVQVSSTLAWSQDAAPYPVAAAKAKAVIAMLYGSRLRPTTYLNNDIITAYYRPDLAAWLMRLNALEAGGSSALPNRFADKAYVRIDNSGPACVVATDAYKGGDPLDLERDPAPCR